MKTDLRIGNRVSRWTYITLSNFIAFTGVKVTRFLPVHVNPSPVYPVMQVHTKLPGKFVHVANSLHPPLFSEHSSTSAHFIHHDMA